MSRIGLSITKSTPFRNSVQEFSNVYYYEAEGTLPTQVEADNIIDEITAVEKGFHSTSVTFVRGRLWSAGGDPGTNNMISQKNLSGTGNTGNVSGFDKERAYLFRLRAGNDSRGNPVYLRKWYHSCGIHTTGVTPGSTQLDNTTGFTQVQRDQMAAAVDTVRDVGGAGIWHLVSKFGRPQSGGEVFRAHQFLEHHQFGDMWRAQ